MSDFHKLGDGLAFEPSHIALRKISAVTAGLFSGPVSGTVPEGYCGAYWAPRALTCLGAVHAYFVGFFMRYRYMLNMERRKPQWLFMYVLTSS